MSVQPLGRDTFGDPKNSGNLPTREEANKLLEDWISNDKLRLHCRQVGGLMYFWARESEKVNEEEAEKWYIAGLLHDADWEKYPELHCQKIIEHLEEENTDPDVLHAIASHSPRYFGVIPVTPMDKMIYAFDELSGLVHAYSLMRGNYDGMDVRGVKKKLKDKHFAAGVDRNDVTEAAEQCGHPLDDIVEFVVTHQASIS